MPAPVDLSIVIPMFDEEAVLPLLIERLRPLADSMVTDGVLTAYEIVAVDDGSRDATPVLLQRYRREWPELRVLRLRANAGHQAAISAGIAAARGSYVVTLDADLQDPPNTIPELLSKWLEGAQVVWAVRNEHHGRSFLDAFLSRTYYFIMRRFGGLEQMPATGADFFLVDRRVVRTLGLFQERNTTILGLLCSIGFRQTEILYDKQARLHGNTGWTLGKKLKLVVDSIVSFTFLPIRYMLNIGIVTGCLGFTYAGWITYNYLIGTPVEGWSSLMFVMLMLGGLQMVMLGILGEYLWRALEETRSRPLFLIEASTDQELERRLYGKLSFDGESC